MKRGKQGQLQISFGMIFSVILIIAFIGAAIYFINIFLNFKKCSETGLFKQDLQETIDKAFNSEKTSEIFPKEGTSLSKEIEIICFADFSRPVTNEDYEEDFKWIKESGKDANVFFLPRENTCEGQESYNLKHLNISKITGSKNPFCFKKVNGKIEMRIEQGIYDNLVTIKEA